jgi:hyperosmotically inducible protein
MSTSRWVILTVLLCALGAGSACTPGSEDQTTKTADAVDRAAQETKDAAEEAAHKTKDAAEEAAHKTKDAAQEAADDTKNVAEEIGDKTKEVAVKTADKTKEVAVKTADKTKEIAGAVADKSKDVVSATGEKITDGWITTKLNAKFVDETLLKDSKINVDSKDHVVTLKGTVKSDAGKARAVAIARGTEGVVRVIDQLVVTTK